MNDVIRSFTDALLDAGIVPTCPIIADGTLNRGHVDSDRAGSLNLAYVLHLDGKPAGWWMYFKTGATGTWSASGKREPLTPAMRKQIADAKAEREQEKQKTNQKISLKARYIWDQAEPITEQSQHPYLVRKRINPHGSRLYKGELVVPLMDETDTIVSLLPVSMLIREKNPDSNIIICADNDPTGIEKGRAAANACGGSLIFPPLAGQDFNDLINAGGVFNV